jgi:hypothetical protein
VESGGDVVWGADLCAHSAEAIVTDKAITVSFRSLSELLYYVYVCVSLQYHYNDQYRANRRYR